MAYEYELQKKWLDKNYQVTQRPGPAAASTRKFYRTHQGYDFATPAGTPITAKTVGEVIFAGYDQSGWGNRVGVYEPETGKTTYLSHLSSFNVKPGQKITPGTLLGKTGGIPGSYGAGNTTGAHLDITEYIGKQPVQTSSYAPSVARTSKQKPQAVRRFNIAPILQRARSKYGNKLVAYSTNPERFKQMGVKGKIVRL